jgi:hypothetical protein
MFNIIINIVFTSSVNLCYSLHFKHFLNCALYATLQRICVL